MARRKKGRDIHGILLLDKRLGVSSNRALQEVKRLLDAKKAGHTGSLDPLASGLLPLCFGEATKVSAFMLDDDKRYQVSIQLGIVTDTGDAEGEIIATQPVPELSREEIENCVAGFVGEIEQIPPMYSALKHQGKKLYELAREGKTVERKARKITLYSVEVVDFEKDTLKLDVGCSKGTYIRTLAEGIGNELGCGASVTALRRTEAGQFKIDNSWTIEQLQALSDSELQEHLIAVDKPLDSMPAVHLTQGQVASVRQGQRLNTEESGSGIVRMYYGDDFLGLGELAMDGKLAPKKLFHLNSELAPV